MVAVYLCNVFKHAMSYMGSALACVAMEWMDAYSGNGAAGLGL